MDSIGTLDLSWAQGYDGSRADYITRDVICFKCGNKIKFVGEDGQESVFPAPPEGLGLIAVQGLGHLFAFANQVVDPTISVYQYPSFRLVSELKDGAKLEYTQMTFSASEYLATLSGIPDFQLTIWNYRTGAKLVTNDVSNNIPTCVTFNPANWRQVCTTTKTELDLWQIENSNDVFVLHKQKVQLPAVDGSDLGGEDRDIPTRASTRMSRMTINLPQTCVAGVKRSDTERFEEYQDDKERVVPSTHVWTPSGDIIMGCTGGQLLRIDGESNQITMIYNPGPRAASAMSNMSHHTLREMSDLAESSTSLGFGNVMTEGSIQCMALHKKGLFVAGIDGTIRQLEILPNQMRMQESYPLGVPITSLNFNPAHHKLAVGSDRGCIHVYDPSDPGNVKTVFDIHHGNFVGVDTLALSSEHCVTVREDGELQVWQIDNAKLSGATSIGLQACCVAASPLTHMVAVGSITGHVYFVDVNKLDDPRIIDRIRLHSGPVQQIVFSDNGHLLVTGSDDGHIFVLDGRPSHKFQTLGHVGMDGVIKAITTFTSEQNHCTKVVVTANTSPDSQYTGATRVMYFDLPDDVLTNATQMHMNLKCAFKDDAIHRLIYNFTNPAFGVAASDSNVIYTLCQKTKQLFKMLLPTEPPKKEFSKDSYLKPVAEFDGHQLPGGLIKLSPHQKWLATCGCDGRLSVRAVGSLDRTIEVNAHDFRTGGTRNVTFTADSCKMLTIGHDGTLTCYKWNFSNPTKAKSAVDSARARQMSSMKEAQAEDEFLQQIAEWASSDLSRPGSSTEKADKEKSEKEEEIEKALESDLIYTTPTPVPGNDATWLQARELEAHKEEDKQYADLKKDLRMEIRDMRRKLQAMMKTNESVPDVEQLGHHDFDLDTEEQSRLEAEGEAEVQRIREEKEFENLAKMYLSELIKKECWDDMIVKGRGLVAFNSAMEVNNYPMKKRSTKEMTELQNVKSQRQVELEELKARRELVETAPKSKAKAADEDFHENDDAEGGNGREKAATNGSLGAEFGGGSDLFYSQFELHTREQKMNQIILLQDAIYRIKMTFNKEFDSVFEKKEQEIAKIKDKNKRILKILDDLNLAESVFEPEMGPIEKPEILLTVDDKEVKVEKFLTPEQQKKQEEEQKAEEERRLREKGDNWRERGLDLMMGGVLEIKKEDELKKDVPVPAFISIKPEDEWTEDEKKAAQEYEKKVKDLNEEREKYRKQLEMELRKLQSLIQDGAQQFNEALQQLFMKKIKTEMVIYQEELKIERMKYSLLLEEELDNREAELGELLEHKKQLKLLAAQSVAESKKNMDEFHEQYRNLEVEEKLLDKNFKKEFSNVPAVLADQLYKLFRRRPRGQKARGSDTPIHDPHSGNPFSDRPSTARKNDDHRKTVEAALSELDKQANAPEGCEVEVWIRLCNYRREKVTSEQMVKQKAQVLADMEDFYRRQQASDEKLRTEIDDLVEDINKLKEDRLRFTCNLEVQLLLRQGQVEVDAGGFIHDYRSSLLLHRSVVEELNGKIRQLGESKISSMVESKDFRKGIIQLEWEHQKMTMEMEDLQNKMRDIQNLKVTREIQAFLNEDDHDAKKAQEIATLEQTIVLMKQHHEKNILERKAIVKELSKTIREKQEENEALTIELEELNVSVNERRHIHEVNADKRSDVGRELRYKEIVQRRKLVDLAKAQAQEVAVLRAEVERLRMRTFPALVQVEN